MKWLARVRRALIRHLFGSEAAERTAAVHEAFEHGRQAAASRYSRGRLALIGLIAGPEAAALTVAVQEAFEAQRLAEERLRSFLADAGHELRTPLATIHGWIDLYVQGGLRDPGQIDHAMERMQAEVDRMRLLVQELVLLADLDASRPLNPEPVDVAALADEVVDDARVISNDRVISREGMASAVIAGDCPRLQQMLRNLVGNAVQHTAPGTPVTVTVGGEEGRVVVAVRDEGEGIAPEHLPHVRERFYRVHPGRGRDGGSSGLGLAIVEAIANAHGGTVAITSVLGRGTTVRVSLPAAPSTA